MNVHAVYWNYLRLISILSVCWALLSPIKVRAQSNLQPISPDELQSRILEANQLAATPAGAKYYRLFHSAMAPAVSSTQECARLAKEDTNISLVWIISEDGRIENLLYFPADPGTKCAVSKLSGLRVPRPPRGEWLVYARIGLHPGSIYDSLHSLPAPSPGR